MVGLQGRRAVAPMLLIGLFMLTSRVHGQWKQADGPLKTRWAKEVSPGNAWPEYPRPQMVRAQWMNLNGLWQFAAAKEGDAAPVGKDLAEQILVPYPMESSLSGIMRHEDRVWYRRTFEVPREWGGRDVLLHLDAVNWEATVYLNGKPLPTHKGGYDAFGFNITGFLNESGPQEIIVGVVNTPDEGNHARGKQTLHAGGIFYTPASGIWQTVWLEPVAKSFIERLHADTDIDNGTVKLTGTVIGDKNDLCKVEVVDGETTVAAQSGSLKKGISLKIDGAKLWSPSSPFLYGLRVTLMQGAAVDEVKSYFGMRKIALGRDAQGLVRPMLNNEFVFQVGPLDQGYWPDGIYTAPTDEALKFDIEITKKLGFNMTRKHVKVEPERWYYWADKLGLIVWQDMPSMRDVPGDDGVARFERDQKKAKDPLPKEKYDQELARLKAMHDERFPIESEQFEHELDRLVASRANHPCIVQWVVFNEGWGQYATARLTQHVKELDPTRLVDNASGWTDKKVGDVIDMHHYPDPSMPPVEESRAAVLGEFGGLGLPLPGHTWSKTSWGYRGVGGPEQLTAAYEKMLVKAWHLKDKGLCAVVYTQITDVETECNGLLTYDREVVKPDLERASAVNCGHLPSIPEARVVVPSAREEKSTWRYAIDDKPDGEWFAPDYDDSHWKQGPGGFGTEGTPGAVIGTTWSGRDIWIRRQFELPDGKLNQPQLLLHHDDDAEVYLNGVLAAKASGYASEYQDVAISDEAAKALVPGKNVIAIHCHQNAGGQFIDAGLTQMK